jgi:hypothetical protein
LTRRPAAGAAVPREKILDAVFTIWRGILARFCGISRLHLHKI